MNPVPAGDRVAPLPSEPLLARRKLNDESVLQAVAELAGDGYGRVTELFRLLPDGSHRDRRQALHRAVNHGLVIEPRGPDGAMHVSLTSEGWRVLRGT